MDSLLVWQKAQEFALFICSEILGNLPAQEKYALVSQLRRSAQSIAANIAEGYGRYYYQEGIRFTYIARGSLEESYSHLSFAYKMGYLSHEEFEDLFDKVDELRKLTNGFINYLKNSKRGVAEPGAMYYTAEKIEEKFRT
ncbi:MAG TPA: four helix bundle protein [Anaerolineaceae bacterium]|nr:four helix bundle protein [Anaerolineaceae bacterium]